MIAIIKAQHQPMGLAYDPQHSTAYPSQMVSIFTRDFQTMRDYGFSALRTYRTIFNNVKIATYAQRAGMRMALGVMLTDANRESQIEAAIEAAELYPNHVKYIFIGNEDLDPGRGSGISTGLIIQIIQRVKQAVRGAGVKVGTVQRTTEWVNPGLMRGIAQASDVLGVNVYAFFTPNTPVSNPLATVQAQMNQVQRLYPSAKAMITEVGGISKRIFLIRTNSSCT